MESSTATTPVEDVVEPIESEPTLSLKITDITVSDEDVVNVAKILAKFGPETRGALMWLHEEGLDSEHCEHCRNTANLMKEIGVTAETLDVLRKIFSEPALSKRLHEELLVHITGKLANPEDNALAVGRACITESDAFSVLYSIDNPELAEAAGARLLTLGGMSIAIL